MRKKLWGVGVAGLVLVSSGLLFLPGCTYIAQAARGQLRLMAGRVANERALETVDFTDEERDRLQLVPRIKEFGEQRIGLSATRNYETINPEFRDAVWNVSATAPDRFTAHYFAYPVVGKLPYIGYFDRESALEEQQRLDTLGWETYVRSAGAYSTLGWFRDPLWRSMLAWDEEQLANTVLHELAHATLWLPGHGDFNESLATFLGDEASARYMEEIRVERPGAFQLWQDRVADGDLYRRTMHELVARLDGLYRSGLPTSEVLTRKAEVIAEARERWAALPWRLEGYRQAMAEDRIVNNAKLVQFRIYNTGGDAFDDALARFDGDLPEFISAAKSELTARRTSEGKGFDPWAAIGELQPSP
jgi:predicted aminopeptidase